MRQPIAGYHRDEEGHWVVTREGRDSMLGVRLNCKKCDEGAPQDSVPG